MRRCQGVERAKHRRRSKGGPPAHRDSSGIQIWERTGTSKYKEKKRAIDGLVLLADKPCNVWKANPCTPRCRVHGGARRAAAAEVAGGVAAAALDICLNDIWPPSRI